jgi:hypothetical protein
MKYAIWRADLPAGAATFATEADALAAVRAAVAARGTGFVAGWSLVGIPRHGDDWRTVAEGAELVERAMAAGHQPSVLIPRWLAPDLDSAVSEPRTRHARLQPRRSASVDPASASSAATAETRSTTGPVRALVLAGSAR